MKAGPDIDILASQVIWFKERILAGGWPLFLIQWGDVFSIVPGCWASDIRRNPELENILRRATTIWAGALPVMEFMKVLRNPKFEYEKVNKNDQPD